LYLPDLYGNIVSNGVVLGNTGYIWRTGAVMLIITVGIGAISIGTAYLQSYVANGITADLRAAVYRHVQALSAQQMNRFGIASLITRNTNDVEQVELLSSMTLAGLIPAILTCVGGVIMAVRESAQLSLLLVVAVPVLALVLVPMLIAITPLFRSMQALLDRINLVVRDQITGIRVIRAFGQTRAEQERFSQANADLTGNMLRTTRIFALYMPIVTVIFTLSGVGVVWFGGRLVGEGAMPLGNVGAFLSYIVQILTAVLVAGGLFIQLPRATASAERIMQVIDEIPSIADSPRPVSPAGALGAVEFRAVSFGYPGSERPVVRDLTFTVRPGQLTAIIGGIGSGKSTLLDLVPRILDATSGTVLVGGTDVRAQPAERLWSTIGRVPQAAFLFHGTVASNLRFGAPEATEKQLWHALEIAQASDFVSSMPEQLDSGIDQGGTNISAGQRQRLCIARALVKRPRVYLLDDCFSALDAATEARLRATLRADTEGATLLVVAQRIASVRQADQIIVLDAGSIVGIGTHEELLADCAAYQEIAASQLGEGVTA
jgi:ATP-binding cassette subfamily B protein